LQSDDDYHYPDREAMSAAGAYLREVQQWARDEPGGLELHFTPVYFDADADATEPARRFLAGMADAEWLESVERGEPDTPLSQVVEEVLDEDDTFHRFVVVCESAVEPWAFGEGVCHLFTHRLHIGGSAWDGHVSDWAVRVEPATPESLS